MPASLFSDMFDHLGARESLAIRPVDQHGVPDIHNGEYPGRERDFFTFQAVGIAAPIPPFMMIIWDVFDMFLHRK